MLFKYNQVFLDRKGLPRREERRWICEVRKAIEVAIEATENLIATHKPACTEEEDIALREVLVEFNPCYGEMECKRSGNAKKYKSLLITFIAYVAVLANHNSLWNWAICMRMSNEFLLNQVPKNLKLMAFAGMDILKGAYSWPFKLNQVTDSPCHTCSL